jgi:cell division septation protein DedD
MPDLNLQEDESLENLENSGDLGEVTGTEETREKKGGGMGMILVVLLVLVLVGGGAFVLNKLGVVHLWGKKPAPAVVQLPDQQPAQQAEAAPQTAEANQAPMIETPPVDDKAKAPAKKVEEKHATKAPAKTAVKPAAKEMPAPAATNVGDMKGEYTVQVSAWRDKEIAQEMVRRLSEAGYPAFVEDRAYKGGTWYTVRIGHYASRKEAESAVQNYGEELKTSYWIDKVKAK